MGLNSNPQISKRKTQWGYAKLGVQNGFLGSVAQLPYGSIPANLGPEYNYSFIEFDSPSDSRFALRKAGDLEEFMLYILGAVGVEYFVLAAPFIYFDAPDPVQVSNVGWEFSADGAFRIRNITTGLYHAIAADDGVLIIDAGVPANPAIATYTSGSNFRFTPHFELRDRIRGIWFRPWVIQSGGYTIEITQVA